MRQLLAISVLSMALAGLAAAPAAQEAQEARPQIQILAPRQGSIVNGPDVVVEMEVRGVNLSPQRSRTGAYLLLQLDDSPPVKTFSDRFTFQGVGAGTHLVRVELRRNDDTSFNPPVRARVQFSVRAPAS